MGWLRQRERPIDGPPLSRRQRERERERERPIDGPPLSRRQRERERGPSMGPLWYQRGRAVIPVSQHVFADPRSSARGLQTLVNLRDEIAQRLDAGDIRDLHLQALVVL